MTGTEGKDLTREQLLTLYKIALDEYRAAVSLSWDRQKFFLTINALILGAAASFSRQAVSGPMLAGVFGLGVVTSVLGFVAVDVGHKYYRRTRSVFQAAEELLGLPMELRVRTTEGMARISRVGLGKLAKITTLTQLVLALLGIAEAIAMVVLLRP